MADITKYAAVDVAKLRKAPWNYKTDDAGKAEALTRGIAKRGQIVNLIVRDLPKGLFEVVNGNHRLDSLHALKAKKAVVHHLGNIPVEEAMLIAVETNDLGFQNDELKFAKLLADITQKFSPELVMETTAIPVQSIIDYTEMLKFDFSQFKPQGEEDPNSSTIGEQYRTILFRLPKDVAKRFEAQLARVKRLCFPDQPAADVADALALVQLIQVVGGLKDQDLARHRVAPPAAAPGRTGSKAAEVSV